MLVEAPFADTAVWKQTHHHVFLTATPTMVKHGFTLSDIVPDAARGGDANSKVYLLLLHVQ